MDASIHTTRWKETRMCSSGMDDSTGVGYMSSLMAFLVVFRFVNLYVLVVADLMTLCAVISNYWVFYW